MLNNNMSFTRAVGALLISAWAIASSFAEVGEGKGELPPDLQTAIAARQKANLEGDTEKIEKLMTDEYLQTDILGRVQNKSEWLADYFRPLAALIKAGQFHWDVWEEKNVQIRQFGDVVIVVGTLTLKGRGASPVPGRGMVASPQATFGPVDLRFTRIWINRNDKWLLAAIHNATVPEQGKK
jgi:hypothetical protein